ncbi:MAG: hypothetical protein J6T98_03105 [Salinivirgaceae bacterium]|nr:hypothetical protein [Salinivirgaceae bacterium]
MKKSIILMCVVAMAFAACDKNENEEPLPTPENDTMPTVDTANLYLEFNYQLAPIRFDSVAKLFPNDKLWFWGEEDVNLFAAYVYRGIDTTINDRKCLKIEHAKMYQHGMIKEWKPEGYMYDSAGCVVWDKKVYYNYNLSAGDTFQSKRIADSTGYMVVDSIITRTMLDNSQRKYFYLSSKYAKSSDDKTLKYSSAVWIEGIGGLNEDLEIGKKNGITGGFRSLLRYYERAKLVYEIPYGNILYTAE